MGPTDTNHVAVTAAVGQTFHPEGPDGLEQRYATSHGSFMVPSGEAYPFYSSFCVDQSKSSNEPEVERKIEAKKRR